MTDKKISPPIFMEPAAASPPPPLRAPQPTGAKAAKPMSTVHSTEHPESNAVDYIPSLADRDEDDQTNEVNRVLLGGILIASPSPPRLDMTDGGDSSIINADNQCRPACQLDRNERCEMFSIADGPQQHRCVCRPGFARMFPDRPCKR